MRHSYNIIRIAAAAVGLTGLVGCSFRDEIVQCPPLTVDVTIADRTFTNAEDFPLAPAPAPDAPFSSIIPELSVALSLEDGTPVTSSEFSAITGEAPAARLEYGLDVRFGLYKLTLWGSPTPMAAEPGESMELIQLPDGSFPDVYAAEALLDYSFEEPDKTMTLRRVMSGLAIEVVWGEDAPAVDRAAIGLTNLPMSVSPELVYSGSTDATLERTWVPAPVQEDFMLVPPTLPGATTEVSMRLTSTADPTLLIEPESVSLTLERNAISRVRYVRDTSKHGFTAYIYSDGMWQEINSMQVD